jgi:hypothetical protein
MDMEPGIFARLFDFGWALLGYWWVLVPSGIFAVEPMLESFLRVSWKKSLDERWPKDRRHRHFRWGSVIAVFVASFMAFDDISTKSRKTHTSDQAALKTALNERDEARRQRDSNISPIIDRLSGDLVTARAQIDEQTKEIEKLKPKPPRHLTDDDKRNLTRVFTPLKSEFPSLEISAPQGESQAFAREFMTIFNDIGIKVPRVGLVFIISAEASGLQVAFRDSAKVPEKAERFAKAMIESGFPVIGTQMDTLGEDQFILIVGLQ